VEEKAGIPRYTAQQKWNGAGTDGGSVHHTHNLVSNREFPPLCSAGRFPLAVFAKDIRRRFLGERHSGGLIRSKPFAFRDVYEQLSRKIGIPF